MQSYFESEIKRTEQELVDLKTAQQKFAGVVPTLSKYIDVSIPLSLNSSQTTASGSKIYKITTSDDAIIVPTLSKYYDDVTKYLWTPRATRAMTMQFGRLSDGVYIILVQAFGTEGSGSDVSTLINGGSVTLTNRLTVQATNDFTLGVL